jgi:hypothetical protein
MLQLISRVFVWNQVGTMACGFERLSLSIGEQHSVNDFRCRTR